MILWVFSHAKYPVKIPNIKTVTNLYIIGKVFKPAQFLVLGYGRSVNQCIGAGVFYLRNFGLSVELCIVYTDSGKQLCIIYLHHSQAVQLVNATVEFTWIDRLVYGKHGNQIGQHDL